MKEAGVRLPKIGSELKCVRDGYAELKRDQVYTVSGHKPLAGLILLKGVKLPCDPIRFVKLPSKKWVSEKKRLLACFPLGTRVAFYHCSMGSRKHRGEVIELLNSYILKVRPDESVGDIIIHIKHVRKLRRKIPCNSK
jgi:hypothetical protein